MNQSTAWPDLHLKLQENLIHFLDVELDLAGTLCDRAKSHPDHEHRAEILGKIKQAIDTVRYFSVRIVDDCTRKEILDRADDLEYRAQKIAQ
jgi:hypothetical protein